MKVLWVAVLVVLQAGPTAAESVPFLRVLGIAQDGGVPHTSCACERCEAARDHEDRRHWVSSLALVIPTPDGPEIHLVDATPDITQQLVLLRDVRPSTGPRVNRSPLTSVFLTHAHMGHYLGLAHFGFEVVHTQGLTVHATERMSEFLRTNQPFQQLVDIGNISLQPITPRIAVSLPQAVSVTSILVPHRDELSDTVGYIFARRDSEVRVLFVPDTDSWREWNPTLPAVLDEHQITVALLDGSFYSLDELPGRSIDSIGHPLMVQTMDLLQSRVDDGLTVGFIHLNHSNPALNPSSPERESVRQRGFTVVQEGFEIEFDSP